MRMTMMQMVARFHSVFVSRPDPKQMQFGLDPELRDLRLKLIQEETREVFEAIDEGNQEKMLQEIADLLYVTYGLALTLGVPEWALQEAFESVHAANMSKLGPDGVVLRRNDGKVLKGPNYRLPDMKPIVAKILSNIW